MPLLEPAHSNNPFAARLKECPADGDGVHKWTFHAANYFKDARLSPEDAEAEIEARMTRKPNPADEVTKTVANVYGGRTSSTPRWPAKDWRAIAAAANDGPTLRQVNALSPVACPFDQEPRTDYYLDQLFPGNPLLCLGLIERIFTTAPRETFRGVARGYSLLVPSPMFARVGLTKDGKPSMHCAENTGPRRYLVVEFDSGSLDRQAALLWHLQKIWALVMIVYSGSKSLHGWFPCPPLSDELREQKLERFFNYAARLGCDTATWHPWQFCRMPDGRRYSENKNCQSCEALAGARLSEVLNGRQAVFYFDPENTVS